MRSRQLPRLLVLGSLLGWASVVPAQLPDPANGGLNGGPLDLLLLCGHDEMNFGIQPPLDETYQKQLAARGYRVATVREWQPLTTAYLRQFNTVVYLGPSPYLGGGYFDHTNWRSGQHLLTVRRNVAVLRDYVKSGGGLLVVPVLDELCARTIVSLQDLFQPYGLSTECAVARDEAHAFVAAKLIGVFPILYSWTDRIAPHPATEGVKRVYYPAYCTRWDDNYTTIPLFPQDPAWTTLVQSMPGTKSMCLRGSIYDPASKWFALDQRDDPALVVARDFGSGRVAVCGLSAFHLYYLTYSTNGTFAEANFSRVDGIAMDKGDGQTPSDMHRLLDNLYRWLAAPAVKAGLGGFNPASGVKAPEAEAVPKDFCIASVWANQDPIMTNAPVRPMKILVGARSAFGGGQGSPADWAYAAKAAGYDVIAFTEPLERIAIDQWPAYVVACAQASTNGVALLPGLDMETDLGDRVLITGYTIPIRTHFLTADHKRLHWTGSLELSLGDVLSIYARPQRLATVREKGALPPDLYYHAPGVAVATYAAGKQVDDGLFAYRWLLENASMPIPVAVHEVAAPAELPAAAALGLQNYVNADIPANAAFFFRQGHASFAGNPMRYYVSSGPLIDDCFMDDWRSPFWKLTLKAHAAKPITEIVARDQYRDYRRFTPHTNDVTVTFNGNTAPQRWFRVELTDAAGGKAYLSPIRTLPHLSNTRCMDRQNTFTPMPWFDISYQGKTAPPGTEPTVPGVKLAAGACPKTQLIYCGDYPLAWYIFDDVYDSTFVPGVGPWGGDSSPTIHDLPIPEYAARSRFYNFLLGRDIVYRVCQADVTLKQNLTPQGDVWPIIASTVKGTGGVVYVCNDPKTGVRTAGTIATNATIDLLPGGVAGDLLALTPLRVSGNGKVGFPPPGGTAKAGTTFTGAYLRIDPAKVAATRAALGFDGPTPFKIELKQGQLERVGFYIDLAAKDGGVAGRIVGAAIPGNGWLPVRLSHVNPRWPVALIYSLAASTNAPTLTAFDCWDGQAAGRLDVSSTNEFYFGNVLMAGNPNLNLAFASDWTKAGARIEVNNPTPKKIDAVISSPQAIQDRKPINVKVSVPAGSTIYVEAK